GVSDPLSSSRYRLKCISHYNYKIDIADKENKRETGKNCSRPPTIENGDTTTFLEKGYTSGSFVEFKCQKFYAMEGQNRSFCDNGNWTKAPLCLEQQGGVRKHDQSLKAVAEARIQRGAITSAGFTWSTTRMTLLSCFIIQLLWAFCAQGQEITCDPPLVTNGTFQPQKRVFREEDVIRVDCNPGFHFETDNMEKTAECTKNGWLPIPRCILKLCDYPHIENGRLTGYYKNHSKKDFPVRLGVTIFYRCLDGYVSKSESTWNLIRCTADGWDPMPKCLKKCSPIWLSNGRFLILWQKYYKEGDEISYVCDHEYVPENQQAKVTCTKNNWMPTPRCILNRFQGKMGRSLLPKEPEDVFSPVPGSLTRIDDQSLLSGAGSPHAGSLRLS
ncbi:unnamed protein product, partial [Natator depressus]